MRIHCLQHLEFETLGIIRKWVEKRGHTLTLSSPSKTLSFPDPADYDLLLVLGGLMSVYEKEAYPWIKLEKEFVKKGIEADKAILGSCFGGQLIAEVLGGRVSKNKFKEIGWHKVKKSPQPFWQATKKGESDVFSEDSFNTLLKLFPEEFFAFMWHGDTFEIPPGARKLFESKACPNQGYLYKGKVLGLQFHPEADEVWIAKLVQNCGYELRGGKYVQEETEILGQKAKLLETENLGFRLLDWFEEIINR